MVTFPLESCFERHDVVCLRPNYHVAVDVQLEFYNLSLFVVLSFRVNRV